MDFLKTLLGLVTGSTGGAVGAAVSRVTQIAALLAAIAPVALWLRAEKDSVFISITYGELAFWGTILALFVIWSVRMSHRAPPP